MNLLNRKPRRKILAGVLALLLCGMSMLMVSCDLEAEDAEADDSKKDSSFEFFLNEDGKSYTVKGKEEVVYSKKLSIPAMYDGKPVTAIGDLAFYNHREIESLILGRNITAIGQYAFRDCTNLGEIDWNKKLIAIGASAFKSCEALAEVHLPEKTETVGKGAFSGCKNITAVTIPESTTVIGKEAFSGCGALISLIIENATLTIEEKAFSGCGLKSIEWGQNPIRIGKEAFNGHNSSLLNLPVNLVEIGEMAFATNRLNTVKYEGDATAWCKIPMGKMPFGEYSNLYLGELHISSAASLNLLDGETKLGDYLFAGNQSLYSITIPDSVTELGAGVFYECKGLEQIVYNGTQEQWDALPKGADWDKGCTYTLYFDH